MLTCMKATAKILVVDDERGIREKCRRILTAENHLVETAENGQQGLELIYAHQYDLILVDPMMPVMDGLPMMEKIHAYDPDLIMIAITGFATVETAVEAMRHGACDYLSKPFEPDHLITVINRALEKHRFVQQTKQLMAERDRRLLEVANEKSKIRAIVHSMADAVLVINRDQQLVLWNPAAIKMLNITNKIEPGQHLTDIISLPDLTETIKKAIDPIAAKFTSLSEEIRLNNSTPHTLMANVSAVWDENLEMLGVVCILRDITQFKQIERVKSQFVSMVAHELRAPLSAISNYLASYLANPAGDNPECNRQMLQRSKERADSLLNLIEDLLQISRLEAQQASQKKELLHLSKIIQHTVEWLTPQANDKHITIEMEMPGPCPAIEADRVEMEQLFTNLISNAIKYNRDHGKISISCLSNDNFFTIKIEDTGIGIAEEDLPHIFEDFFRISREETRYLTGTGLGLSIVKRIVESNLGSINVASELNKGTTFSVSFPIKRP